MFNSILTVGPWPGDSFRSRCDSCIDCSRRDQTLHRTTVPPLPCPGFVCPPPPVPPVHGLVCARTTPVWVRGVDGRFKADGIESKDLRGAVDKYINVGDWVLDQGIAFMASSKYFERKR